MTRVGFKHSEETRLKMSKSKIGNKNALDFKHTNETRKKVSIAMKGRIISPNHRINLSNALKGKKKSLEHCKKLGASHSKGEFAGYQAKHLWIRSMYGNPPFCEKCGKKGEKINQRWSLDWANINHKYRKIREDYIGLCKKCHGLHDREKGIRKNKKLTEINK